MNQSSLILIVDDEPGGRYTLEGLLADQAYELAFASSGPETLEKATELIPDLILLDVMMPGMDGFEVCEYLRADPLLAEVPIILVTALDDRDSRLRGLQVGADDFISKPFDPVELRARVRTITRLNRYRRLLSERTQRQKAEEAIRRREQEMEMLKEAERLKDQFISNVSHELRTPLSTITILSGNLDTLYPQLNDEQRQTIIHDIRQHIRLLNELVSSILDVAHLENKPTTNDFVPLDLGQLVKEEVHRQVPLAAEKSQCLCFIGADHSAVCGDAGQLRQIIRNLLNNAIKYTPQAGQIICECIVSVEEGTVAHWPGQADLPPGCWSGLRVADTGLGIDSEHLSHIFERFYRVQAEGNIPGTGLGLSIVRELVNIHNGHIAVSSTPGEGSTFAVYLPRLGKGATDGTDPYSFGG